jgi:hypothetical protein
MKLGATEKAPTMTKDTVRNEAVIASRAVPIAFLATVLLVAFSHCPSQLTSPLTSEVGVLAEKTEDVVMALDQWDFLDSSFPYLEMRL